MANPNLPRPILNPVAAFDANNKQIFTFSSIGGSQVVKNRLIIKKNDGTGEIVYEAENNTLTFVHILNPFILTNGVYYTASIYTYDAQSPEPSEKSNDIQFYCYTTPILKFTNLNNDGIVNNATYAFSFSYEQEENEPLSSWILNIYEEERTKNRLVATSGVQYTATTDVPFSGSHIVSGLENGNSYYAQLEGITEGQTKISTENIRFTVKYIQPEVYTPIILNNKCTEGYIEIQSNIGIFDGVANPSPPIYLNDTEVDLTQIGSYVKWENNLSVIGDFVGVIVCRKLTTNSNIFSFTNDQGTSIEINWINEYEHGDDATPLKAYASLIVKDKIQNFNNIYEIRSNYGHIPDEEEKILIRFGRKNNIYEIYLNEGVV